MNKEERQKLLSEGVKTPFGRALVEYLNEELDALDSAKGHKEKEEYWAREMAVEIIEKLFAVMGRQSTEKRKKTNYT